MPYCSECGKEVKEGEAFCPHCGAALREPELKYRRPTGVGLSIGRVLAAIFGVLLIIASIGLIAGGGGIMWVRRAFTDPDGYLTSGDVGFHSDSYAIALRGVNVNMGIDMPAHMWMPRPGDLVTIRLVGASSDPSKGLFIGIAREADVSGYLGGVDYYEVSDLNWPYSPWGNSQPQISYRPHQGSAPAQPPTSKMFWVASASGVGTQTLEWEPETGSYWVVVMNSDGSPNVEFDMRLGARIPILRTVGDMLMVGGFIALAIGGIVIYYGALRRF
jgi:hypothetical protein